MDKQYQIIWADDEIEALLDETGKALLSKQHIDVIKCNNATILEEKLKTVHYRIDAVIVDANFSAKKYIPSDENDVSGLRRAMYLLAEYKYTIPFYLYTQRVNLFDFVDEDDLSYFKDNDAIFFKGNGLQPLLKRIKNDIDKKNSVEFQIDNHFKKELDYFQRFDEQCNTKSYSLIRELLIKSRNGSLSSTEFYFNSIRTVILDKMNAVAAYLGIVPEGLSLNNFSKFLCSNYKEYSINKEILPTALYGLMQYVVEMVQDGSHGDPHLKYKVHQYVSNTKDTLIIQSLLFVIIELVSWFIPYIETHMDKQQNLAIWQMQDKLIENNTDDGLIIEKDERGYYHIGTKYSIILNNIDFVGKKVKVNKYKENTHPITKKFYPLFVRENDLQIID